MQSNFIHHKKNNHVYIQSACNVFEQDYLLSASFHMRAHRSETF